MKFQILRIFLLTMAMSTVSGMSCDEDDETHCSLKDRQLAIYETLSDRITQIERRADKETKQLNVCGYRNSWDPMWNRSGQSVKFTSKMPYHHQVR